MVEQALRRSSSQAVYQNGILSPVCVPSAAPRVAITPKSRIQIAMWTRLARLGIASPAPRPTSNVCGSARAIRSIRCSLRFMSGTHRRLVVERRQRQQAE